VPSGFHNGRTILCVLGRYPKEPDGDTDPVLDLVICHGDFLNANHDYMHANKSIKAFGSYGDIMIRDRKIYVVPTPFSLVDGVAHQQTLILPAEVKSGKDFVKVGALARREAAELIVGYSFDLQTNELVPKKVPNPGAGREHLFHAWRLRGAATPPVSMRIPQPAVADRDAVEEDPDS
jgi:hypothetical protein